jgi:hypothetical protein
MLAAGVFWGAGCRKEKNDNPPPWTLGTIIDWHGRGVLASVETDYGPLYIIRLEGTHYEMGVQYGRLLGGRMVQLWDHYLGVIAEELGFDPADPDEVELAADLMNGFLDDCWAHMEPHTPQAYKDEIRGIEDGFAAAAVSTDHSGGAIVRRILMLADVSQAHEMGEIGPMTRLANDGFSAGAKAYFGMAYAGLFNPVRQAVAAAQTVFVRRITRPLRFAPMACSFFGVWGQHTDGRLLASRNLDWSADIGLQDYRLLTVFVPTGETPHVTVGYVGFIGALAGLSTRGIALGHVGATNTLERLKAEPGLVKSREILAKADNLDDAVTFMANEISDGLSRPNSIGANGMVVFGDPAGGGAAAEAVVMENSGVFTAVFRYRPDCTQEAALLEFDQQGDLAATYTHESHPERVNLEGEAHEIDASGLVRTFQVDAQDQFVRNADGDLIDDATGLPYRVGYPIDCAFFRGDEALAYGVRKYQMACHGPRSDSDDKQMHRGSSYQKRYLVQHDMIEAYRTGTQYVRQGEVIIADNGGEAQPIGPQQAIHIARQAAMDSNVYSVVYDCTNLELWVAYESGSGEGWIRAADNPYFKVSLADLLYGVSGAMGDE